jgi:hypothetical protein
MPTLPPASTLASADTPSQVRRLLCAEERLGLKVTHRFDPFSLFQITIHLRFR